MNYEQLLPTEPPEGLLAWLTQEMKLLRTEILIYKADWYPNPLTDQNERMCKLTCTACHRSMYATKTENQCHHAGGRFGFIHPESGETLSNGKYTLCPICGAEVKVKHVSGLARFFVEEVYPMSVHRIGDKLALCGWCVQKWASKDGHGTHRQTV